MPFTSSDIPNISGLPKLNSFASSNNVIFLNFSGFNNIANTEWNGDTVDGFRTGTLNASPFSLDANHSSFSRAEQIFIENVAARTGEDYQTFNVNVTTDPSVYLHTLPQHRQMVLITSSLSVLSSQQHDYGGISDVGIFGKGNYYGISWVMYNNLPYGGTPQADFIADAASHEAGHTFGLLHEGLQNNRGITTADYYGGTQHWGPLMGDPYNQDLTQWSKGQYAHGNNKQDELYLIAKTLGFRPDEPNRTSNTATVIPFHPGHQASSFIGAQFNSTHTASVSNDTDWFKFNDLHHNTFTLTVKPLEAQLAHYTSTQGNNLQVGAKLFAAQPHHQLNLIESLAAPDNQSPNYVTFKNITPTRHSETFYLQVYGVANHIAGSNYGSLGHYDVAFAHIV